MNPVQQASLRLWQELVNTPAKRRNRDEYIYPFALPRNIFYVDCQQTSQNEQETAPDPPAYNLEQCTDGWYWPTGAIFLKQLATIFVFSFN